jgi:hypothetical protein
MSMTTMGAISGLRRLRSPRSFTTVALAPSRYCARIQNFFGMVPLYRRQMSGSSIAKPLPGESNPLSDGDGNPHEFWRQVPEWRDVSAQDFLSYRWSVGERDHSSSSRAAC